jgi:ankyrin repeat protein
MPPEKNLSKLDTELLSAIEASDTKAVASHLKAGANPNACDQEGYTALHGAAAKASSEIVKLLLEAGADVNGPASDSAIALCFATAHTGDNAVEMVKLLIASGSNVNHQWEDEARSTVLTDLLNQENNEEPSAEILRTLLHAGADPNRPNGRNETPLMLAVGYKEQPELAELLLEHGAQVNAVGSWGMTALMRAIQCGNARLVERLIIKGADVHQVTSDTEGNTPLTLALNLDELHGEPSAEVLGVLLRAGANPNTPNARGWTPLHFAACLEDVTLTGLLLQAGADARRPHANGNYPIDTASHRGHAKVVKRLLAAGSPTLEQAAAERMEGIWKRIGAWYARNHPTYAENLERSRPATPAKVAALEEALETELPADFRAFLLRFGGGAPSGRGMSIAEYDVLHVEQILRRWKGLGKLREEGVFAEAVPHELSEDQKQVAWTWWHPGWIPFAQDGGGNLYCVDLAPGPRGDRGQVIGWEMHGGPLRPRAASLEAFFGAYLEKLMDGRIQLHDDE